jgi:hypothetical protein
MIQLIRHIICPKSNPSRLQAIVQSVMPNTAEYITPSSITIQGEEPKDLIRTLANAICYLAFRSALAISLFHLWHPRPHA